MLVRPFAFSLCTAVLLCLAGCAAQQNGVYGEAEAVMTHYNPISLQNYQTAREYSAAGRYELAREHYLLAYAAAGDDVSLRDALARELKAVDLMIKSLR